MKKVYCKDCKYFKKKAIWMEGYKEYCEAPENLELSGNYYSKFMVYTLRPETINSNNKCEHYQRKWWKFWVK